MSNTTVTFNAAQSAVVAGLFGADPGTGGDNTAISGVGASNTITVFDVSPAAGCDIADVVSVFVYSEYSKSVGFNSLDDGGFIFVGDATTLTPFGTLTAPLGQYSPFGPSIASRDFAGAGMPIAPLACPIGGVWAGAGTPTSISIILSADAPDSPAGEQVSITPPVVSFVYAVGTECAPVASIAPTQLVTPCVHTGQVAACVTTATGQYPTLMQCVSDCDGNLILPGSVDYPASTIQPDGSMFHRSYFVDPSGPLNAAAVLLWNIGDCVDNTVPQPMTAGASSIADGVLAGTLGPDGVNWVAPANLRSVTVYARVSQTANAVPSGGNRVEVSLTSGVFVLLQGESFTWTADENQTVQVTGVYTYNDAAAAVVWVAE